MFVILILDFIKGDEMMENNLIIYKNKDGNIIVDAIYKDETLWLTQKGMSKVFDVQVLLFSGSSSDCFPSYASMQFPCLI